MMCPLYGELILLIICHPYDFDILSDRELYNVSLRMAFSMFLVNIYGLICSCEFKV